VAIAADQSYANQSVGRRRALRLRAARSRESQACGYGRLQESATVNRIHLKVSAGVKEVVFHGLIEESSFGLALYDSATFCTCPLFS
jgi:hypothetical protein